METYPKFEPSPQNWYLMNNDRSRSVDATSYTYNLLYIVHPDAKNIGSGGCNATTKPIMVQKPAALKSRQLPDFLHCVKAGLRQLFARESHIHTNFPTNQKATALASVQDDSTKSRFDCWFSSEISNSAGTFSSTKFPVIATTLSFFRPSFAHLSDSSSVVTRKTSSTTFPSSPTHAGPWIDSRNSSADPQPSSHGLAKH